MNTATGTPTHTPRLVRYIWLALMGIAILILCAAIPGYLSGFPFDTLNNLNASPGVIFATRVISSIVSLGCALLCLGLATLLFVRKPDDRMTLFISFYLIVYAVLMSGPLEAALHYGGISNSIYITLQTVFATTPTVILLCTFPTGHLQPAWTKWTVTTSVLISGVILLTPAENWSTFSTPLAIVVGVLMGAMLISAMVSLVYRYRKVLSLPERVQVKWVISGLFIWFAYEVIVFAPWILIQNLPAGQPKPWWVPITSVSWWLSLIILPLFLTIAILRYRLFDIDLLIRRTLVYGALTLTLGLVFFTGVALLQQAFGTLSGTENSPVAIVLSTLAIAALFSPLRRRIQHDIDRRFFRKKYNAEQTLEQFALNARDKVELEQLSQYLLAVVQETMQPEQASLWLRPQAERSK